MRAFDERSQPTRFFRCPVTGMRLTACLNYFPWIVPPAPIVAGLLFTEDLRGGQRVFSLRMDRAEIKHPIFGPQLVVEDSLLRIRFSQREPELA